jgi:hypothetical protein
MIAFRVVSSNPDVSFPDGTRPPDNLPPDNSAGSSLSGLSDRVPHNCGCTLAVTTNPKVKW